MKSITLPSGLAGTLRGLKVAEANTLANAMEQKRGTALDSVYQAIWLSTADLGPYASVEGAVGKTGALNWSKVLVCDRFSLMLAVRSETYGPEYSFRAKCSAPSCGERFSWELSLDDLPRKPLPELSLEAFKNGNRIAATLPGDEGREFWFSLPTGEGEKKAEQLLKQNRSRQLTAALASRIVEIQGVAGGDKLRFIDDLPLGDAHELLSLLDEADGGVDSNIEIQCPACGDVQEVALPFGKEFWVPLAKRKNET